jgi:hypothetical protein
MKFNPIQGYLYTGYRNEKQWDKGIFYINDNGSLRRVEQLCGGIHQRRREMNKSAGIFDTRLQNNNNIVEIRRTGWKVIQSS